MKLLLTVFLALLLAVLPVSALDTGMADDRRTGSAPAAMTKSAHILDGGTSPDDRFIAVWFSPFKMPRKSDVARQLQVFNHSGAEILLSNGSLVSHLLVPGQEVDVTFTYRMIDYGDFRELEIISVEKIQMKGSRIPLRSGGDVSMSPNTFIGTVLTVNKNNMTVYVEGGLAYYGDEEYIARGQTQFKIGSGTKIFDKAGKSINASGIKPLQRVEIIDRGDGEWRESAPPMYGGGTARTVRLLGYGDKWFPGPSWTSWSGTDKPPSSFHRQIQFVVEKQLDANELQVLMLGPREWYRYQPQKAVVRLNDPGLNTARYQPGQVMNAWYRAVNNKANPPVYSFALVSEIAPGRRWTAQEIAGVFGKGEFGKPEGITLTVPDAVSANTEFVAATWTNNTALELGFGEPFILERKTNGKWGLYHEPDREDNYGWNLPLYTVAPRSEAKTNYYLRVYSDKLPKGDYRIVTSFSAEGYMPGYVIYSSEFTVK